MLKITIALMLLFVGLNAEEKHEGHDHGKEAEAKKAKVFKIGKDVGQMELSADRQTGNIIFTFKSGEKELILEKAPIMKVTLRDKKNDLKTIPVNGKEKASVFSINSSGIGPAIAIDLIVNINSKDYTLKLFQQHDHEHGHGDHDHDHE